MASQVFWLLSYVSLGLALTLGNRPTSVHSSSSSSSQQQQQQQQQQKQQSTSSSSSSSSSSQTQRSRQDHRFARDQTLTNVPNELIPLAGPDDQLDRLRSYRYDEPSQLDENDDDDDNDNELTTDWLERSEKSWRDSPAYFSHKDRSSENVRRRINVPSIDGTVGDPYDSRGTSYLEKSSTAVLDAFYPRHRDLPGPSAPPPNVRQTYAPRRYDSGDNLPIIGYSPQHQQQQQQQPRQRQSRTTKKTKMATSTTIGERDFSKKRLPIVVHRSDAGNRFDADNTGDEERLVVDDARSSGGGWPNEPMEYGNGNNEMTNRGDYYSYGANDGGDSSDGGRANGLASGKPPGKRNQGAGGRGRSSNPRGWSTADQQSHTAITNAGANLAASQLLLRAGRGNRQYDVPQIVCPAAEDGMERFACPTPDRMGRYRCIDDHVLCDGFIDCPAAEDEDRQACMFYKTTKAHLDVLADALLRWARGR